MDTEICRICLNASNTLVGIFALREESQNGQPEPSLADMLNACADCHIKINDGLPQQICMSCVRSAQNAYRFKLKCEENYRQLLERRNSRSSKKEPEKTKTEPDFKHVNQGKEETAQYKCQLCSKEFAHMSLLRVHKKWHLENQSRVKVTASPKQVPTSVKRNTKYPVRQKKSRNLPLIKNHSHSSERPFACTNCPIAFQSKTHLVRHMRNHTGERPYQCPHCADSFARSDYCRNHMNKVHRGLKFTGKLARSKKGKS
ncbi:uncharacterized protein Dmoj_GI26245 [Drosophila mojavensis]|uniref:Uncharacterized protein n=1 Tax=Drosophila mojavensis TaxID=7230 RepID=A0A0Q9XGX5_DROMO|nr:uncharacterized protein Dmoj_GI26245 [Drosophila mojavensis]